MTGHWSYCTEDGCGPETWPNGEYQSPIDIDLNNLHQEESVNGLKFVNYDHFIHGEIINNGHSVQVIPEIRSEHPEVYGGGLDQVYRLIQYHFHWGEHDNEGSEHKVGGQSFAGELHLVHQGTEDPSKIAVIGVLLQVTDNGDALYAEQCVLEKLKKAQTSSSINGVRLSEKLPHDRKSFFRYEGSLTTPPCTECVTWTVFSEPVGITESQLNLFRSVYDGEHRCLKKNFRPVQPVNNRVVKHIRIL